MHFNSNVNMTARNEYFSQKRLILKRKLPATYPVVSYEDLLAAQIIEPARIVVGEHRREKARLQPGRTPLPADLPRSIASPGLLAHVASLIIFR
jgi:hypothetical protein